MSKSLTETVVSIVKLALKKGYMQHDIAAYFGINQGRISEINTGKRGTGILPAPSLPDDFPGSA